MTTHRLPAASWVQIWLHGKPLLLKQKLFTEGWEKLPALCFAAGKNTGVTCDVCECRHNVEACKCDLPQIKVTEHCTCSSQQVDTPHYCQNYEKK